MMRKSRRSRKEPSASELSKQRSERNERYFQLLLDGTKKQRAEARGMLNSGDELEFVLRKMSQLGDANEIRRASKVFTELGEAGGQHLIFHLGSPDPDLRQGAFTAFTEFVRHAAGDERRVNVILYAVVNEQDRQKRERVVNAVEAAAKDPKFPKSVWERVMAEFAPGRRKTFQFEPTRTEADLRSHRPDLSLTGGLPGLLRRVADIDDTRDLDRLHELFERRLYFGEAMMRFMGSDDAQVRRGAGVALTEFVKYAARDTELFHAILDLVDDQPDRGVRERAVNALEAAAKDLGRTRLGPSAKKRRAAEIMGVVTTPPPAREPKKAKKKAA